MNQQKNSSEVLKSRDSSQVPASAAHYRWSSPSLMKQGEALAADHALAKDLGLSNQVLLLQKEFIGLLLMDFLISLGVNPWELELIPHGATGLFKLVLANGGKTLTPWMKCDLNSKSFRLPSEALKIIRDLRNFPDGLCTELFVLQQLESKKSYVVNDYRGQVKPPSQAILLNPFGESGSKSSVGSDISLQRKEGVLSGETNSNQSISATSSEHYSPQKPKFLSGAILVAKAGSQNFGLCMWQ